MTFIVKGWEAVLKQNEYGNILADNPAWYQKNYVTGGTDYKSALTRGFGALGTLYCEAMFVMDPSLSKGLEFSVNVASVAFWEIGAIYYPIKLTSESALFNYNQNIEHGVDPFIDIRIMK